jgi:hypothetical protein
VTGFGPSIDDVSFDTDLAELAAKLAQGETIATSAARMRRRISSGVTISRREWKSQR